MQELYSVFIDRTKLRITLDGATLHLITATRLYQTMEYDRTLLANTKDIISIIIARRMSFISLDKGVYQYTSEMDLIKVLESAFVTPHDVFNTYVRVPITMPSISPIPFYYVASLRSGALYVMHGAHAYTFNTASDRDPIRLLAHPTYDIERDEEYFRFTPELYKYCISQYDIRLCKNAWCLDRLELATRHIQPAPARAMLRTIFIPTNAARIYEDTMAELEGILAQYVIKDILRIILDYAAI
jgi:hypothetical protein